MLEQYDNYWNQIQNSAKNNSVPNENKNAFTFNSVCIRKMGEKSIDKEKKSIGNIFFSSSATELMPKTIEQCCKCLLILIFLRYFLYKYFLM